MKDKKSSEPDSDAVFIGWQETNLGDILPLFNVTAASHPLYGSTVSEKTLLRLNLQPPKRPFSNIKGNDSDTQNVE